MTEKQLNTQNTRLQNLKPVIFLKNGGNLNFGREVVEAAIGREISVFKMHKDQPSSVVSSNIEEKHNGRKILIIECSGLQDISSDLVSSFTDKGDTVYALVNDDITLSHKLQLFVRGAKRLINGEDIEQQIITAVEVMDRIGERLPLETFSVLTDTN